MSLTQTDPEVILLSKTPLLAIRKYKVFTYSLLNLLSIMLSVQVGSAQKLPITISPYTPVPEKKAEVPLKKSKRIFTDAEIAVALENIRKYPDAARLRDSLETLAQEWLQWEDESIRLLIPEANIPRAFDLNTHGCPIHGDTVFNIGGVYPWLLDFKRPLTVKCPAGGEIYPNENYPDDGWGWVAPDQERYWFVAYANEHLLRDLSIVLQTLARTYVLTGNSAYAHKAVVILGRLAEVYPSMDHPNQSRYGALLKIQGQDFPGKIFYHIQEARFIKIVGEAYDLIWDWIDQDHIIQAHYGKNGLEVREFIEANVLEEAIRAYQEKKIQGNYGMHQNALLYTLLARDHPSTEEWIRKIVDDPGRDQPRMGLMYTLYNQIFRDGMALESPEYNYDWATEFQHLMHLIKKAVGRNLYKHPKSRLFFDSLLKSVAIGKYTPNIGDAGHTLSGAIGRDKEIYLPVFQEYRDSRYLQWLFEKDNSDFPTFESLFMPRISSVKPLPDDRVVDRQKSRLFAGYGFGILNNPADRTGFTLLYGKPVHHAHSDLLTIELFANGQRMLPDFGYPDAMNAYVRELYTWSTNTVSHNTVVVDAQRQNQNLPGIVHHFADGEFARAIDATSFAYQQTTQYRRSPVMVDVDSSQSYVVDFFRVEGGHTHDYFLHGPPGKTFISLDAIKGKAPTAFTQGKLVPWGAVYDDEVLGKEGYAGSFASYAGSGYQYLMNVSELKPGNHMLEFHHVSNPTARLRIHHLHQPGQMTFTAEAYDKPRARKNLVKFLISRHKSEGNSSLKSCFLSVLEPYANNPYIQSVRELSITGPTARAVVVKRAGEMDIIINDIMTTDKVLSEFNLSTDASIAVVTLDDKRELKRVFFSNGTYLKFGEQRWVNSPVTGIVEQVDYENRTLKVVAKVRLTGNPVIGHFYNEERTTIHPLRSLHWKDDRLTIQTDDEILVGRIRASTIEGDRIGSENCLPLYPHYTGTYLLDHNFQPLGIINKAEYNQVIMKSTSATTPMPGAELWIGNIGPGDQVVIKSSFSLQIKN